MNHSLSFPLILLSAPIPCAIDEKGSTIPFPIQIKAIPAILSGKDVMAAAQSGTGKTARFTLPMVHRLAQGSGVKSNDVRALVLVPTGELAVQVGNSIETYGKYLDLKSGVVYGGVKINSQMMKPRSGVDTLVATPGRLLDLFRKNTLKF